MSSRNNARKPDNIIWIEEVILNNLEENVISGAVVESVQSFNQTGEKIIVDQISNASSNAETDDAHNPPVKFENSTTTQEQSGELKIGIAEIELKDESYLGDDRVNTLSRIVTGKIKYFIENVKELDEVERYQYWIIKMPSLMNPSRRLSEQMDVARREISFYTEILPNMKSFVEAHGLSSHIDFKVPTCYYGRYLRPVDPDPELDIITHILDSESLLVLDDLRVMGFGKRHFGSSLLVSEAAAAVEEIVKFHAVSWVIQTQERKMKLNWPHLYDWENLAHLYHKLLDIQFSSIQKFFSQARHPKAHDLYAKYVKLRPHLLNKLFNLLAPSEQNWNTLIHMDFWSENLMFRRRNPEEKVPPEEADLECYILDWQLVSYGKPMHDLGLLTMLSMDPNYRREHATWLLQYYYENFKKIIDYFDLDMPFDVSTLKREYKQSCVLATFMAMASIDMVRMEESTQERLLEALADLVDDKLI